MKRLLGLLRAEQPVERGNSSNFNFIILVEGGTGDQIFCLSDEGMSCGELLAAYRDERCRTCPSGTSGEDVSCCLCQGRIIYHPITHIFECNVTEKYGVVSNIDIFYIAYLLWVTSFTHNISHHIFVFNAETKKPFVAKLPSDLHDSIAAFPKQSTLLHLEKMASKYGDGTWEDRRISMAQSIVSVGCECDFLLDYVRHLDNLEEAKADVTLWIQEVLYGETITHDELWRV